MSGRRRRTVAILGAAVVLAIVSACGPAEGSLDAVRDRVNAVGSPPAGAAKSAAHLVVTPARATVGFGAPLKIAFMLAAAGSPLSGQDVAVAVGGNSLRSTTDARGGGSVTFPSGVLPAGRHRVTASYAGGPEVLASSTGATVTVRPAVAAVTLTITPTDTGGFTVQARLRTSTAVAAGGAVTFAVDRAALGQRPVRAGRAAIAVPASLGVGNHVVMATYSLVQCRPGGEYHCHLDDFGVQGGHLGIRRCGAGDRPLRRPGVLGDLRQGGRSQARC